jgi:hypothetical protein
MSVPTEKITVERLTRWSQRLSKEHATPMLLVGAGHDHKLGQVVVLTCEDIDNATLRELLLFALMQLSPDAKCDPVGNAELPNCEVFVNQGERCGAPASFIIRGKSVCFKHRGQAA